MLYTPVVGQWPQKSRLGTLAQLQRQLVAKVRQRAAVALDVPEGVGTGAGSAGTLISFRRVATSAMVRGSGLRLERQRIEARAAVDHPLQGRIGDQAAIPIALTRNFDGWKSWR